MRYCQLTSGYLVDVFPEFVKETAAQMTFLEEELPHCLYPAVLIPFLKGYFKAPDQKNDGLVERIFDFFEDLAANGDIETKNLLQVSLLEPLWDYKESYSGAVGFMRTGTKAIFDSISVYLNKP